MSTVLKWRWVGLALGLIGAGLGGILFLSAWLLTSSLNEFAVVVAGYGLLIMLLGALVMATTSGRFSRSLARRCDMRWAWVLCLGVALLAFLVGLLTPPSWQTHPLFAVIHTALVVLPGLFLFSLCVLVTPSASRPSWRQVVMAVTGGAGGILLAMPVEIVGLVASALGSAALTLLVPGGKAHLYRLLDQLQQWVEAPPSAPDALLSLLTSPVVFLTLALTLGVVTPLVEEFAKGLTVGVLGRRRPLTLGAAFLLGAASGLGFAWFEGVSNGALGLGGVAGWVGSIGTRFLATGMHCLTSGLIGLGWAWFGQGRRWRLLLTYGLAVFFHGAWNFNVLFGLGGASLILETHPVLGTLLLGIGAVIQITLIAMALAGLVGIPWVLRMQRAPEPGEV